MMAQSVADIGKIIASARRHRGLTQTQLAQAVGASQNWVSEVESGKATARMGKVLSVLGYLGVRLRVSEAPWLDVPPPQRSSKKMSLDQILSAHTDPATPPKRPRKSSR